MFVLSQFYQNLPFGAIAQLVERLLCKQDVDGSNPSGSTIYSFSKRAHSSVG